MVSVSGVSTGVKHTAVITSRISIAMGLRVDSSEPDVGAELVASLVDKFK